MKLDSVPKTQTMRATESTTGSTTANLKISHAIWLTNYSAVYTGDVGNTVGVDMAYVRDRTWEGVADSTPTLTIGRRTFNRSLVIKPNRLNVLMLQHTFDNYAAGKATWATGYNLTVLQFSITPRFDIF